MNQRGFTLFEVLVALAIAALVLTGLLKTFSLGFTSLERARDSIGAALLAESTLEAVGVSGPPAEGAVTDSVGRYLRQVSITAYGTGAPERVGAAAQTPVPRAVRVVVTVGWPADNPARSVRLETLRLVSGP